jgi:hypothetical protein
MDYGYAMHCGICALEEMTQLYLREFVWMAYVGVLVNKAGLQTTVTEKWFMGNGGRFMRVRCYDPGTAYQS